MNWIATNIRFPEDQYTKLKIKAAKERRSIAAVIREAATKIVETEDAPEENNKKTEKLIKEFRKLAEENSKSVPKGFDFTKALREIRYQEE